MKIVVATDNNFVQHCAVTLLSVLKHNRDVCVYLLTEGLEEENERELHTLVEHNGGTLEICKVATDIVRHFPMSQLASGHISIATYYRLFITTLLPQNVEKVIYLDCDMVVRDCLEGLWNTPLEGKALAAVCQPNWWSDHNLGWERLSISREYGYFNAGMLVMNMKFLRNFDLQSKALNFIHDNSERIISHDQDVLNSLLHAHTLLVSCKWNFLSDFLKRIKDNDFPPSCRYATEKRSATFAPAVVHFTSKPKPWHYGCRHPYVHEYYELLKETKWADFKPQFEWRQYLSYVIIPTIKKLLKPLDVLGISDRRYKRKVRRQLLSVNQLS